MLKNILILFITISLSLPAYSQLKGQLLSKGKNALENQDYYSAEQYLSGAMMWDSADIEVVYHYALAMKGINNYEKAARLFEYVGSYDSLKLYPESWYWQALMEKNIGKYRKARDSFNRSLQFSGRLSSWQVRHAEKELMCQPEDLVQNPIEVDIFNAGGRVNTEISEFAAFPVRDSIFYYTSLEERQGEVLSRIYEGEFKDGQAKKKGILDTALYPFPEMNIANGAFSQDGRSFYFSVCDEQLKCRIFVSEMKRGEWQKPQALDGRINRDGSSNTQPWSLELQGKEVLVFVSDRKGGRGKLDLWYSVRTGPDWADPVNFGDRINSPGNEITPYYDPEEMRLYFSSDWHCGLGGYDILENLMVSMALLQIEKEVIQGVKKPAVMICIFSVK